MALLADPSLRRSMGEAGREFALGRFDARVMVETLEQLYREALEDEGGAAMLK